MSQELFNTLEFPPAAFGASTLQVAGNKFCRADANEDKIFIHG